MKIKIRAALLLAGIIIFTADSAFGAYSGGTGEPNNPYLISTAEDLNSIGVNPGDWSKNFKMVADVNLSAFTGSQFKIIGGTSPYFSGIFDGNDHEITNFSFIDKTRAYAGLFGRTTETSKILNVHLVDVNVCGSYEIGGLVGYNLGQVLNCSITGVISAIEDVGGLIGQNRSPAHIEKCSTDVTMQNYSSQSYVGCLVGWNMYADIIDCSASGKINGSYRIDKAGGLVGSNTGKIERCYSTADIKGYSVIGGLLGEHDWNDLKSSYATGTITAEVTGGGLVGFSTHSVINCYATGDVNCARMGGGLIGEEYAGAINCYSTGYVAGNEDVGGLFGLSHNESIGCFWDINTSGQTTSMGGTGLTTSQMQTATYFINAGWDFVEIWNIGENQTYPYLRTEPAGDLDHDAKVDFADFAIMANHWLEEI